MGYKGSSQGLLLSYVHRATLYRTNACVERYRLDGSAIKGSVTRINHREGAGGYKTVGEEEQVKSYLYTKKGGGRKSIRPS